MLKVTEQMRIRWGGSRTVPTLENWLWATVMLKVQQKLFRIKEAFTEGAIPNLHVWLTPLLFSLLMMWSLRHSLLPLLPYIIFICVCNSLFFFSWVCRKSIYYINKADWLEIKYEHFKNCLYVTSFLLWNVEI